MQNFPDQVLNPALLQWKLGALTTRLAGSPEALLFMWPRLPHHVGRQFLWASSRRLTWSLHCACLMPGPFSVQLVPAGLLFSILLLPELNLPI